VSSSALAALVGNDAQCLDELVTVVAGMVRSCLVAMHREEQNHDDDTVENSSGTPEQTGDCIHPPIEPSPSSVSPGEHGTTVCYSATRCQDSYLKYLRCKKTDEIVPRSWLKI